MLTGDLNAAVNACIQASDDKEAVRLLEAAQKEASLEPKGKLLLGVMLFLPPFVNYEGSRGVLEGVDDHAHFCEAAVWRAYLYYTLSPDDQTFANTLENYSDNAASCYSLAQYCAHVGKEELALEWNRQSIQLERFPNNLIFDLIHNLDHDNLRKTELFREIEHLVVDKSGELKQRTTAEELYQDYWDELILGRQMTSLGWKHRQTQFGRGKQAKPI